MDFYRLCRSKAFPSCWWLGSGQNSSSLGMQGNALTGASLVTGLVLGMAYQFSTSGIPSTFDGWFGVVVYGGAGYRRQRSL